MRQESDWARPFIDEPEHEPIDVTPHPDSIKAIRKGFRAESTAFYKSAWYAILLAIFWFVISRVTPQPWSMITFVLSIVLAVAAIIRAERALFTRRAARMD